jgi:hypothetical protein
MEQGVRKLVAVARIISDDTAIVGIEEPAEEELGRTLGVCPGGSTAAVTPVDLGTRSVDAASLARRAAAV